MKRLHRNLFIATGVLAGLVIANEALRPWYLNWGATKAEINRVWPGDELIIPNANRCTRAITINAPVEQVWPWIIQIGQDRAGFYSYTFLENLVLADMKNADRIIPEFQTRSVGDTVWLANKNRYGEIPRMRVVQLIPNRAMVLVRQPDFDASMNGKTASQGAWQFLLEPVGAHSTRLVMRGVAGGGFNLFGREIFDPAHFIMERGMMLGIKKRAERAVSEKRAAGSVQG